MNYEGPALARQLKKEGRTKAWLAEQCGISPQHLSAVLTGKRPLTPDVRTAAHRALGINPVVIDLFKGRSVVVPAVIAKSRPAVAEFVEEAYEEAWQVSWIEENGAAYLAQAAARAYDRHHKIAAETAAYLEERAR